MYTSNAKELSAELIEHAAHLIFEADGLFITSGAGMGVDSGLPDFRGDEGFWKAYPMLKEQKLSFYDIAYEKWFRTDSGSAW